LRDGRPVTRPLKSFSIKEISVAVSRSDISISVTDILGNIICKTTLHNEKIEIDLSNVASGIYFIILNSKQGPIAKKIVKE
jgi:hypothetical protein